MKDLIDDVFVTAFDNAVLGPMEDQARFDLAALATRGDRLAFTTDSFVVDPLFFPGGDIGKLAVCGTINDLAVGGATPLYLSCAVIIEEGDGRSRSAPASPARWRRPRQAAGVQIVTGDTKVVPRGACDKLFITTQASASSAPASNSARIAPSPATAVLVNGLLGDHGAAILCARGDMAARQSDRERLRRPARA